MADINLDFVGPGTRLALAAAKRAEDAAGAAAGDAEAVIVPLVEAAQTAEENAQGSAASAAANATALGNAINQSDSFRTALMTGVARINSRFDTAMLQATKGLMFDFTRDIFRVGAVNSATAEATGAMTFSRAATALALNGSGVYQSFAAGALRKTAKGILIEAAATQLFANPTNPLVGWNGTNTTPTAVAAGAPDNTTAAYDLVESTTNASGTANRSAPFTPAAAGVYALSIHVKKGARRYCQVQCSGGNTALVVVDFDNKTIANVAGITLPISYSMEELGNGWFRVTLVVQLSTAVTNLIVHGAQGVLSTDRTYSTVSGTAAVRIAMAQAELGAVATSPILTGGATRVADAMTLALPTGDGNDLITIAHSAGVSSVLRRALASSNTINIVTDGDHAWLGRYIQSISLVPEFDTALVDPTDGGAVPYLVAMDGTFYWDGAAYASEADMVLAMGATGSMGTLLLGGYVAPDAPNLLGTIDFTSDTQGFSEIGVVTGTAPTVSVEGGYLKMVATTGNQYSTVSKKLFGLAGKALKFTATLKTTSTDGSGSQLGLTYYGPAFQTSWVSARSLTGTTADTELSIVGSPGPGSPFYVGMRQLSGGGATYMKNPVLVEFSAARNFPANKYMQEIKGVVPASLPAATQIIWQIDTGNEIDRVRLELRTDGSIHLTQRVMNGASGQAWDLNLGTVAAGASFRVVVALNSTKLVGALNGAAPQTAYSQRPVAAGYMRMGKDSAGANLFTGTITGYRTFRGVESASWIQRRSGIDTVNVDFGVWIDGDSYTRYDTGILTMLTDAGYDVVGTGIGGSTFAQQYARLTDANNLAAYRKRTVVWWDGSQNDRTAGAVFTGSITGGVLTVSAVASGTIAVDQLLSAAGVPANVFVLSQLTGTAGGAGTYSVSATQDVTSRSVTAWNEFVWYKAMVSAIGHNRHLYLKSGSISPQGPGSTVLITVRAQEAIDMDSIATKIAATYGPEHVCDPQPFIATLYKGNYGSPAYLANKSDVAFGFFPRDLMMDGAHLDAATREAAVRQVIAPAIEKVRTL